MKYSSYLFLLISLFAFACTPQNETPEQNTEVESEKEAVKTMKKPDEAPHIVFVTGDEEYRSEESMPMIAEILKREIGAKVSVCYSLDANGFIDPNNANNITGLEALETADLMVLFTRFRALPDEQLKYILDYAESGRPIAGFRTATHAFKYEKQADKAYLNEEWPAKVLGQKWIVHHGHFDDGKGRLTEVNLYADQKGHPILRGFEPFKAYSWLYHVEGNGDQLSGDSRPILSGRSLRSNFAESQEYPLNNPVAWTKTYTGTAGKAAKVFFTTLGHPYDFKEVAMRKIATNGILWALGLEAYIPEDGLNVEVANYAPNNSGFGEKFKKEVKPEF